MRVLQFNSTVPGYLSATVIDLLDNNPKTEATYEMWIWPDSFTGTVYVFHHEESSGGGNYASLSLMQFQSKLVF